MDVTQCTGCGTKSRDYVAGVSHRSCGGTFEHVDAKHEDREAQWDDDNLREDARESE